jgi:hypothetical protein
MDIKKFNAIFFVISLVIFSMCLAYNVIAYIHVTPPTIDEFVSARIIGTDAELIFIEMIWSIKNNSHFPFYLQINEAHFFENNQLMSTVHFPLTTLIAPIYDGTIKFRASIPRETFGNLMSNYIDAYSFHLRAESVAKIMGISKKINIEQHLPINLRYLVTEFLRDSFKNAIDIENPHYIIEGDYAVFVCEVNIYNRGQLSLSFRDFEGKVEINREVTGVSMTFSPFYLTTDDTSQTTTLRFSLDGLLTTEDSLGFIITGILRVGIWERIYHFPIQWIGESR